MQTLIFLSTLLYFLAEGTPYRQTDNWFSEQAEREEDERVVVVADVGSNHSLPCGEDPLVKTRPVMWDRQGYGFARNTILQPDGTLFFENVQESNSGLYSCQLESFDSGDRVKSEGETIDKGSSLHPLKKTWFMLKVRTPPYELKNVTVLASTILASVMWETGEDGGYPISSFHIRYRIKNETEDAWIPSQPNLISPTQRHWDVFNLCPRSIYVFEIWANNQLGKGVSTLVEVATHNDLEEIQVGKYLLEGVDTFDTRVWIVAVGVVLGTLCLLGMATCCLLYKEYYSVSPLSRSIDYSTRRRKVFGRGPNGRDEEIELIPNIIFNPVFDIHHPPQEDDNSNNDSNRRVNNNSVILPTRV